MSHYLSTHFGPINTSSLEEYYEATIELNGAEIELDLNFEKEQVAEKKLVIVDKMIENLQALDANNKVYIQDDYKDENEDVTKHYVAFHLEELKMEELSVLIDFSNTSISKEEQLLSKLQLCRVGFYPESKEHFAVFDYTIGRNISDQIVVINVDIKSKIHCMIQES